MTSNKVAIFLVSYQMPERTDALVEHIRATVEWPRRLFVIDNGSLRPKPSRYSNVFLKHNRQTTGGWLAGLAASESWHEDYLAYWFLITSAEFPPGDADPLSPLATLLLNDPNAVGVHPALTADSTTSWKHLITRGGNEPRRTWMIDNIASLYRADWFDSIGRFDPEMKYAWGIDLETCYLARKEGRSLWVHEGSRISKETNVGYKMQRMGMSADERGQLARDNMHDVMGRKYGPDWWRMVTEDYVQDGWR